MGNLFACIGATTPQLTAVAQDVCPFPDYSPGPLLTNMLSVNSSVHLSEHYAAVQASLTPQQQQDFTQTLRTTFGPEGKVSNGALPIVALSLAIFFDTVASRVKGQYVSDQEPVPGLFLKEPTGTYPAPVYTVSKYLRLVPHIANNPTRMRHETEKYVLELNHTGTAVVDKFVAAKAYEDITFINLYKCLLMERTMAQHLKEISNKTIDLGDFTRRGPNTDDISGVLSLNCDPKEASERFKPLVQSLDDHSKKIYQDCIDKDGNDMTVIETIAENSLIYHFFVLMKLFDESMDSVKGDFDVKSSALGKWT